MKFKNKNFKLNSKKGGLTLIEVLVSIAIIALIAAPMLSIYGASTRNILLSRQIEAATYMTQEKMEELISMDLPKLMQVETSFEDPDYENVYYLINITPIGVHSDIFGANSQVSYVHLVFFKGNNTDAVGVNIYAPGNLSQIIENLHGTLTLPPSIPNFSTNTTSNVVYILNISQLDENVVQTLVDISYYQSRVVPGMVVYAKTSEMQDKIVFSPNPGQSKIRTYFSGESYDSMLYRINIKAYLGTSEQNDVLLTEIENIASIKN